VDPSESPPNRLYAENGGFGSKFGATVAVSGDGTTGLVAAPNHDIEPDTPVGYAYLFDLTGDGWRTEAALAPPDPHIFGGFGDSADLSVDGDTALIGESSSVEVRGLTHVFARNDSGWSHETTLETASGVRRFGSMVALSGDGTTAIVGSTGEQTVDIHQRNDSRWRHERTVSVADRGSVNGTGTESSGWSTVGGVAVDEAGTTALVLASPSEEQAGEGRWAVLVFDRTREGWQQATVLTLPSDQPGDRFGTAVELSASGTTAVVAWRVQSQGSSDAIRTILVFDRGTDGWSLQGRFTAEIPEAQAGPSFDVTRNGKTVLVSGDNPGDWAESKTPQAQSQGVPSYSVALYHRKDGEWTRRQSLEPGFATRSFGSPVALASNGTRALIGAPYDEGLSCDAAGTAYVFDIDG